MLVLAMVLICDGFYTGVGIGATFGIRVINSIPGTWYHIENVFYTGTAVGIYICIGVQHYGPAEKKQAIQARLETVMTPTVSIGNHIPGTRYLVGFSVALAAERDYQTNFLSALKRAWLLFLVYFLIRANTRTSLCFRRRQTHRDPFKNA